MNKKYQVFLSSTFKDLYEERKKVLDLLLMADCIPAGMEAFVATDDEQFNVIKKVIDLCDYYILIIGGRYGSISEKTNLSYTEMEYNYAISKNIPVLVFCIDDSIELNPSKKETDAIKNGKLAEFKNQAMRNRLASVWKDSSDLVGKVAISIMTAKQEIDRPGWHRGGEFNQTTLLKQIVELKEQNDLLQKQLNEYSLNVIADPENELPFYGFKIKLNYTEMVYIYTTNTVIKEKEVETTLDDLFKFISLRLTGRHEVKDFIDEVSAFEDGYYVNRQQALVVRNQYIQLGLIRSFIDKKGMEIIELTDKGIKTMNSLNALK